MRHGVESQGLLEQLSIELQELARVSRASIRDDKADIQILRMLGKLRDEAFLREVHHNNAILNFKIFRDTASYFNQCGFPPGHQYYVDSRGRGLSRELSPYSRRGTRDECPRAEPFFVNRCCHLAAPLVDPKIDADGSVIKFRSSLSAASPPSPPVRGHRRLAPRQPSPEKYRKHALRALVHPLYGRRHETVLQASPWAL